MKLALPLNTMQLRPLQMVMLRGELPRLNGHCVDGARTRVGFISPLSRFFCAMCNRIRLKVDGRIKTCLHGREELDLKTMLRQGVSPEAIKAEIATAVFLRPEEHFLNRADVAHQDFVMTRVGG